MQRLFSMFPPGAPGYGLLVLRVIVAISLHLGASGHLERHPNVFVFAELLLLSTLLVIGLFTPVVAVLGAATRLTLVITSGSDACFASIIGPLGGLALILLGPGAHSIDARLFGRKVLIERGTIR